MEKVSCGGFLLGEGLTQTYDDNGQPILNIQGGGGGAVIINTTFDEDDNPICDMTPRDAVIAGLTSPVIFNVDMYGTGQPMPFTGIVTPNGVFCVSINNSGQLHIVFYGNIQHNVWMPLLA